MRLVILVAGTILASQPANAQFGDMFGDRAKDLVGEVLPDIVESNEQTIATPNADKIASANSNYERTVVQGSVIGGAVGLIGCQLADCSAETTAGVTVLTTLIGAGVGDYVAKRNAEYASLQEAAETELALAKDRRDQAQQSINVVNDLVAYYRDSLPIYRQQLTQRRITLAEFEGKIADLKESQIQFADLIEMENVNLAILVDIRDDILASSDQSDDAYYAAVRAEIQATQTRIARKTTSTTT